METAQLVYITLVCYAAVTAFSLWLRRRAANVSAFLHALLDLMMAHNEANQEYYLEHPDARLEIVLPSFFKITFSFKELTLENYLDKETIEYLYNHDLKSTYVRK